MDIGIFRKSEYLVTLPYPYGTGAETITLAYLPLDENMAIRKRHTAISFVKGRRVDVLDDVSYGVAVARKCVKGWTGITDNGTEAPCTPDAVELVARKDYLLTKFVLDSCTNIELLKAVEKERGEREKNSDGTSGQGRHTQE